MPFVRRGRAAGGNFLLTKQAGSCNIKSVIIIIIIALYSGKGTQMKYSRQRELIYKTVMENPIHPSADTVYAMVRKELPNISLGTVYRNLNLLSEQGALRKISMPSVSDHFDGRLEEHFHALCQRCGSVYDVEAPEIEELAGKLRNSNGFQVTGCHMYFTGVCAECANGKDTKGHMV